MSCRGHIYKINDITNTGTIGNRLVQIKSQGSSSSAPCFLKKLKTQMPGFKLIKLYSRGYKDAHNSLQDDGELKHTKIGSKRFV
jgi:hypothetical protein